MLTGERGRIMVSEYDPPLVKSERPSSGISFWIHVGPHHAFLGVWTGLVYRVSSTDALMGLIEEIFRGEWMPKGKTPYRIAPELEERFALRHSKFFVVTPPTPAEQWDDVMDHPPSSKLTRSQMLQNLVRVMGEPIEFAEDLFEYRVGAVVVHARVPAGDSNFVPFMFACWDANRLPVRTYPILTAMANVLPCAVFDTGWGSRVHLGDPYYAEPDREKRYEHPENWRPGE